MSELPLLPPRKSDAHKGDFGHVLVVAGSRGMTGAAVLCASAAVRGGAGLVTAACPESVWPVVAAGNPCVMTRPMPNAGGQLAEAALDELVKTAQTVDVLAIGPGLGRSPAVTRVVTGLLSAVVNPMVVDADALNALGCPPEALRGNPGPRVLTPPPGEFARLTGLAIADVQARREELTREFVSRFGVTLLLKGHVTLVGAGDELFRNTT